ncbi:hypothetical protein F5X97DRAFT_283297 [Nemania serpens]|nr:hypothetical protein F5X97DRAFT_283297 [Nemania serpens]
MVPHITPQLSYFFFWFACTLVTSSLTMGNMPRQRVGKIGNSGRRDRYVRKIVLTKAFPVYISLPNQVPLSRYCQSL